MGCSGLPGVKFSERPPNDESALIQDREGQPGIQIKRVDRRVQHPALVVSKVLVIVYGGPSGGQKASASERVKPIPPPMALTLMASKLAATSLVPASAVA